jgi:hypothetical protein
MYSSGKHQKTCQRVCWNLDNKQDMQYRHRRNERGNGVEPCGHWMINRTAGWDHWRLAVCRLSWSALERMAWRTPARVLERSTDISLALHFSRPILLFERSMTFMYD